MNTCSDPAQMIILTAATKQAICPAPNGESERLVKVDATAIPLAPESKREHPSVRGLRLLASISSMPVPLRAV